MLKRITWEDDTVLSVKLRSDLFTLVQMRSGSCMQFFDIKNDNGVWKEVDLTDIEPLFCIKVAENRLKTLFVEKVSSNKVRPNCRPMPLKMIDYRGGSQGNYEADLIELTDDYSNIGARIIKTALTIENDLDVIYKHELVGMVGNPEKLRKRLVRYFDTGINWDDSKAFIFKGIHPPVPKI